MKIIKVVEAAIISTTVSFLCMPLAVYAGELDTNIHNNASTTSNSSANPSAIANPSATASPTLNNGSESNSNTVNFVEGARNTNNQESISNQINTASSQAAPAASISNTAINNNTIGTYRIGDATCSTPTISVNGYGGANDQDNLLNSKTYGAALSLQIPLGGAVSSACTKLAKETAKKMELSNIISLIGVCADWTRQGIILTDKAPKELREACSYIVIQQPKQINR